MILNKIFIKIIKAKSNRIISASDFAFYYIYHTTKCHKNQVLLKQNSSHILNWGDKMDNNFLVEQQQICLLNEAKKIQKYNAVTAKFGLSLSEVQINELISKRVSSLKDTDRIEFGEGILPKLIYAFCDSPFITQDIYAEILAELQDLFYYFKNESNDLLSDDELIEYMKLVFDGRAQGSVEYLEGTSLEELCRYVRGGFCPYDADSAGDTF